MPMADFRRESVDFSRPMFFSLWLFRSSMLPRAPAPFMWPRTLDFWQVSMRKREHEKTTATTTPTPTPPTPTPPTPTPPTPTPTPITTTTTKQQNDNNKPHSLRWRYDFRTTLLTHATRTNNKISMEIDEPACKYVKLNNSGNAEPEYTIHAP